MGAFVVMEVISVGERDGSAVIEFVAKIRVSLRKSRRGLKQRMKISRIVSP